MDCELIQAELVPFHFGGLAETTRTEVEEHLLGCPACLRSFLALKRELETAQAGPRPSETARARLRRAVGKELATRASAREESWWRRPLAFGFAAAAGMAVVVAVVSVRGQLQHLAELSDPSGIPGPSKPGTSRER